MSPEELKEAFMLIEKYFKKYDKNNSGYLDKDEFFKFCDGSGMGLNNADKLILFTKFADGKYDSDDNKKE